MRDAWARGQELVVTAGSTAWATACFQRPALHRDQPRTWRPCYAAAVASGGSGIRHLHERAGFPAALTDARAFAVAQGDARTASTATTGCSARPAPRPSARFEAADWHGQQRAQRERIEFYDKRVDEAVERLQTRVRGGDAADGRVAAGQAALHRPADRPPPARAGRDLLQLGHDQDPAPQLLPQRLHLRAPGGLAPSTSRTTSRPRSRPTAPTTRRATTLRDDAGCASSTTSSSQREFEDLEPRRRPRCCAAVSAQLGDCRCAPTSRSRCCRRCSSATRAPTSSARSSTASTRRRSRCRSCTTRAAAARRSTPRCSARTTCRCCLQLRARLLHGRRWRCPSAYVQFLRSLMPRKPRSEIYSALGLAEAGQEPCSTATSCYHLRHSQRQVPHRARHQGHGDAGVRPAVASRTCSR